MTRRQLLLLSISALPLGAKGVLDWQRENLLIADHLERSRAGVDLLVLRAGSSKKLFHSYPIASQASLGAADGRDLLDALTRSLRAFSITDGVSPSFVPHYGLRLAKQADLVISFQSNQLFYFTKGRPLHGYLRGGESNFKRRARSLNLE